MAKRILWLCSWYPNDADPFDGDFIQRQAEAASAFYPIDVLVVKKRLTGDKPVYQKREINSNLTEHIFFYTLKRDHFFSRISSLYKFFSIHIRFIRKNGKPDLIHVQVPMKSGLIALYYKWFYRIPYVVTEHFGIYNPYADDHFKNRGFLFRKMTRLILRHAAVLTTVSDSLGKDMNNWVLKKKYTVVPNVVNTDLFRFLPKNKTALFQFIHISNMIPLKNVEGILDAAEKLWQKRQDFRLLFVGGIKQEYVERAKVKELLDTVVYFEGVVSYETVALKMQQIDSLIIFSDTESQSCVVLEALCCGKPCIVTHTGGVKELIEEEVNGFRVNPRDTDDLIHKMNRMISEYEKFDKERISAKASAIYSYHTVGKQFADCYTMATGK